MGLFPILLLYKPSPRPPIACLIAPLALSHTDANPLALLHHATTRLCYTVEASKWTSYSLLSAPSSAAAGPTSSPCRAAAAAPSAACGSCLPSHAAAGSPHPALRLQAVRRSRPAVVAPACGRRPRPGDSKTGLAQQVRCRAAQARKPAPQPCPTCKHCQLPQPLRRQLRNAHHQEGEEADGGGDLRQGVRQRGERRDACKAD